MKVYRTLSSGLALVAVLLSTSHFAAEGFGVHHGFAGSYGHTGSYLPPRLPSPHLYENPRQAISAPVRPKVTSGARIHYQGGQARVYVAVPLPYASPQPSHQQLFSRHTVLLPRKQDIKPAGRFERAEIYDPASFAITMPKFSTINSEYMKNSLSAMHNYKSTFYNNNRHRLSNEALWPGRWAVYPGLSLGYYTGYCWEGSLYPQNYYALATYCPTPYIFDVLGGQIQQVGRGYMSSLPYAYRRPITVSVQEVLPLIDASGSAIEYRCQRFYYNAFWDAGAGAYGYYDYKNVFNWVSFPGQESWTGIAEIPQSDEGKSMAVAAHDQEKAY